MVGCGGGGAARAGGGWRENGRRGAQELFINGGGSRKQEAGSVTEVTDRWALVSWMTLSVWFSRTGP